MRMRIVRGRCAQMQEYHMLNASHWSWRWDQLTKMFLEDRLDN